MRRLFLPLLTLTLAVLTAACSHPEPVVPKDQPEKQADPPAASVAPEKVPAPAEELVAQKDEPDQPEGPLVGEQLGGSTENAKLVLNPLGHVGAIAGVFFTPDGKQLVTVGQDATVQRGDVGSGERLRVLRLPFQPTATALAPDGKTLAVGRDAKQGGRPLLVNLDDGRVVWLSAGGDNGRVTGLAFSADGDRLAAARQVGGWDTHGCFLWDGLKGIWEKKPADIRKGRQITKVSGWGPGTIPAPRCLAFSPDGKRIAVGCDYSAIEYPGQKRHVEVAFLVDVPVGDAKPAPAVPLPISGHAKRVIAVTWAPDGQQVVTAYANDGPTAVQVWSTDGKLQKQLKLGSRHGRGLHFLNDKEILFTWKQNAGGNQPAGHGQSILTLGDQLTEGKGPFLPSGGISCPSAVFIDRTDPKKPVPTLAAFAGGISQNEIVIWEIATGKPLHPSPLGSQLRTPQSAGWSKDGRLLGFDAFEDKDKKPFFRTSLDLKELALRAEPADRSDYLYRYRANGEWSARYYPKKRSMELKQGDKVVMQKLGVDDFALILSPAKEPNWAAWREGRFLILFDLAANKQVTRLESGPYDLAPSPDGRYLLAVNNSQVMYLYRIADDPAQTERAPLLYLYLSQGEWVMWTREGYYAASPNGEKLMGWTVDNGPDRLPTFHPAQRFRKQLYRPDVIKRVLELGNVAEALKAANADLRKEGIEVREGAANLEKLLPPKVTAFTVDDSMKPKVTVKVEAEAAVKGQSVTALRLMVDGRPWPGALKDLKPGDKPEAEWTIDLPEGEHTLAVLVKGPDTSAFSHVVAVKQIPPARLPAMYLLPIGINDYQAGWQLDFAAEDARAVAAAFKKNCTGALFREVSGEPLLNKEATKAAILQRLAEMRKDVKPNDLVVIFFAGHGIKEKDQFYLLPVDGNPASLAKTALSGAELRKSLAEFPCQVLLMLDACHSAAGAKAFKPATDDAARALTEDEVGVVVMCAAMGHEKAIEKKELKHGLFTQALVQALSRSERVPYNYRDNRQYLHHLQSYVFDEVKDLSNDKQHPFLSLPWVVESFALRQLPGKSPGQ